MTTVVRGNRGATVGVFRERINAERAVEELQLAGFHHDQIGFTVYSDRGDQMTPPPPHAAHEGHDEGPGAAGGMLTGAITGGLAAAAVALTIPGFGPALAGGLLATTLTGAAIGAAAGGITGALVDLGVDEDDARFYDEEFRAGHTVVTVRSDGRDEEAAAILYAHYAYDVDTPARHTAIETPQTEGMAEREDQWVERDGDTAIRVQHESEHLEEDGKPEDAMLVRDANQEPLGLGAAASDPAERHRGDGVPPLDIERSRLY
ncbi:MAG: hypothetical protein NTZ05_16090 [Chloroflexi bacterium]|nr:hypothetical protein [Chloroflexota bacterium]